MKKVRIPILNDEYAVYVVTGGNSEVEKFLQWHFEDKLMMAMLEGNRGKTFYRPGYMPVIWMNKLKPHEFAGTLSHEAVHAIDFIFSSIGENETRGELFAHSVGAIVRSGIKISLASKQEEKQ